MITSAEDIKQLTFNDTLLKSVRHQSVVYPRASEDGMI